MKIQVVSLKIKRERNVKVESFRSSNDIGSFLVKHIGNADRENLVVISLNSQLEANCIQTVSIGTLNEAMSHPREIFKIAILTNAQRIVLAHNHPGGSLNPSKHDIEMTKIVKEAGEILGIKVLDHFIVNDIKYISFAEQGLL